MNFIVLETLFHALTFQDGDKHVPVAVPAYLLFKNVVKLVLCLVPLFLPVKLDIIFSIRYVQAIFKVSSLQIRVLRRR